MKKNWFKNVKAIEATVTNPDGSDTEVSDKREVESLAEDGNGETKLLGLRKSLFVPED